MTILNKMRLPWILVLAFAALVPHGAEAGSSYSSMGNERILLMNNWTRGRVSIKNQGYYDQDASLPTYWTHVGNANRTLGSGTNHVMHASGGEILWQLFDCRAGAAAALKDGTDPANCVPTSVDSLSSGSGRSVMAETAAITFRNTLGAQVVSPYYEDGIGTIYFDIVNVFNKSDADIPTVRLEIATNVLEGVMTSLEETINPEELAWSPVEMTVLPVQAYRLTGEIREGVTDLELTAPAKGGSNYFYRVRAVLNHRTPARFRIRRTTIDTTQPTKDNDTIGLITLDNVVASYPAMSLELFNYATEIDKSLTGAAVIGTPGDLSAAFVAIGQTNVAPRAYFKLLTNSASRLSSSLKSACCWYRWRYLDQTMTDWKPVTMDISNTTQLVARAGESIPFDNGVGDVEYYFSAEINSVFYNCLDFTFGTSIGWGAGWSEEITSITNRASYTVDDNLPSCGTDWFVRVREGVSDFEWVKLVSHIGTNREETVRMELVDDHTWRYHYFVSTNLVGQTLHFHFQGKQLKPDETGFAFNASTNMWYSELVSGIPYVPFTSVAVDAASPGACEASNRLDRASTHLLIEFNDELKSFSVSHATYQNFNRWTDAMVGFRGNATYDEEFPTNGASASGVSDDKREYDADLSSWEVTPFENDRWRESFANVDLDDPTYPYYEHLSVASTPKSWGVENGMFVPGLRGTELGETGEPQKSLAWQMDGNEKGTISLEQSYLPGVGEVKFSARLSQIPNFNDFATYLDGTRCTNYAVSAQLTMSRLFDSTKNPLDISPCHPSVSLVGYYRGSKGCYELRFVRVDDTHLGCELYKWTQNAGTMTATLMTSNLLYTSGSSKPGPGMTPASNFTINSFNNLLVPASEADRNENWTSALLSLYTLADGRVMIDGWISKARNNNTVANDKSNLQYVIHFEDANPGPLTYGTFGVGSCDCQAAFGQILKHEFVDGTYSGQKSNYCGVNFTGEFFSETFATDWEFMNTRWRQLDWDYSYSRGESTAWKNTGLAAVIPANQTISLLCAEYTGDEQQNWKYVGCTTNISTFATNMVTFKVHSTANSYIQLRTGPDDASVTVDDIVATAWAAQDEDARNSFHSAEWAYTQGKIEAAVDIDGGNVQVTQAGTNGYVYTFTTTDKTIQFTPLADMVVDRILLVGGGGGGGSKRGGGGGGGGVLDIDFGTNEVKFAKGELVSVKVGAGGARSESARAGGNGGESWVKFTDAKTKLSKQYTAKGGGGGAGYNAAAGSSGTGGGGANAATRAPGSGTADQGFGGGAAVANLGGGGGGAGAAGEAATTSQAGNGGIGVMSDITGDEVYYGGGGGGGAGVGSVKSDGGQGGLGGGGKGSSSNEGAKGLQASVAGEDGLGGGGGGGGFWQNGGDSDACTRGAKGGRGVVIIRVRSGQLMDTLQPSRGLIDGQTEPEAVPPEETAGEVIPMGLRSPYLENGLSLCSFTYVDADPNCVLWLQVCTNCPTASQMDEYTMISPEFDNGSWVTKCVWLFPEAAKGYVAPSGKTEVTTNLVPTSELSGGTLAFFQSLRAPVKGAMRIVMAPEVVRRARQLAREQEDYGRITITKAYCYDEPKLDDRSWWGWNLHTEGWNTRDKSYAYLTDSPDGLSCMLNFSALEGDNNAREANGIGLGGEALSEYKKNNPFVQCPPLTNGIGSVSFRARTFTNEQSQSSWVTLYGSIEPDAYQCGDDWDMWKKLAEFEVTNSTYQTFSWKSMEDSNPPQAVRLEVNAARKGRYGTGYNTAWEKPQAVPIQRVLLDEISVSEPVVPRLVFRDVRPFRSKQLREDALVAVSNVTSESEQPITGESWGIQATVEPQQMADELDTDSLRVFASVHRRDSPWGYTRWAESERIVELPRMGSNLVFRSHISRPESIQEPMEAWGTVQYMVFAEFKDRSMGAVHTNWLDASQWTVPSWYNGITNLNVVKGGNLPETFSAYTIIDSISPKRAWINEVNYRNYDNADANASSAVAQLEKRNQFIEIAVPENADLTDWTLRVTSRSDLNSLDIATFGLDEARTTVKVGSRPGVDNTNFYTFVTLCSPLTTNATVVAASDGRWRNVANNAAHVDEYGALRPNEPYGISLVRPTGVIEHEVVVEGRNPYEGDGGRYEALLSGTNMTAQIRSAQPGSEWFFAGKDLKEGTLGVYRSHGEDETCWTNRMLFTPGELNRLANGQRQSIDKDWFLLPNGTNVWITANVFSEHIVQAFGGTTNRTKIIAVVGKGDVTNIVYKVDPWYEIGDCTTNDVQVAGARGRGSAADVPKRQYTLNLGKVEGNMTINVGDQASQLVVDSGLPRTSPYYPAVMNWLTSKFGDADDAEIHRAEFWPIASMAPTGKKTYLDILDMYWLDIPPTEPDWVLVAGMGGRSAHDPTSGSSVCMPKGYTYTNWLSNGSYELIPATNVVVTITMMITNKTTDSSKPYYGTRGAHAPQYLQGLDQGSRSDDPAYLTPNWTSCTFKVTAALQKPGVSTNYYPLRWFVFQPGSFDENFQTRIEVLDPFLPNGRGINYGWPRYRGVYNLFYRWKLDGNGPGTVETEVLKADSTY